ncbi:hypothetical protein TD95_005444 [Thielaviopsis punctulata]|uniref:Mediator of RNA polymerase II transcription subunit 14 n=1 Tax=Thielaviopsis punctulata TaxID=72032 RepID=A0A0F4ZAC3_9PEZI|nr:hypothetical protein TD95_005444 [Thielaviopsis punctulata]
MENGNTTTDLATAEAAASSAQHDQAQNGVAEQAVINGHEMTVAIRTNDLPPEIVHISEGFVPLARLVTRLAQLTHNQLMDKIRQVAAMPAPAPAPPSSTVSSAPGSHQKEEFDQSNESVARKVALNTAIQKMHGRWIKTLVIADWSRKSGDVSKLIDLNTHLRLMMQEYEMRLDQMINVKRDLTFARLPSPDLKTALHVLSTGDGSFFPDPMTSEEIAKWTQDINTLLTIRLNVDDYDNIPIHFRNFTIENGRVTFKVAGEFEVELTIADEDPATQFWFVDFRFDYSPAPQEVSPVLRNFLEAMVNSALAAENLTGCYKFLHEFVLTHKIGEIKRQAFEMSKSSWTNSLKVEPLDRALAIRYWPKRLGPNNSKHWVIIAVDSRRTHSKWVNPKVTSNLKVTWYINGRAAADEHIPIDTVNVSTETLMKLVIGKHIELILKSMYKKLMENTRYSSRKSRLGISIDQNDPSKSYLQMQCSGRETITVYIEPTTGEFKLDSHSKESLQAETKLNNLANPAADGGQALDGIRFLFVNEELSRKSAGTGWICFKNRLLPDDVKSVLKIRDQTFWSFCMQRKEMLPSWLVICVCRAAGDEFYMCKV